MTELEIKNILKNCGLVTTELNNLTPLIIAIDKYAKQAFEAAKEGKIVDVPVVIDQYGSVNIEQHFKPNKYPTFEDWNK